MVSRARNSKGSVTSMDDFSLSWKRKEGEGGREGGREGGKEKVRSEESNNKRDE